MFALAVIDAAPSCSPSPQSIPERDFRLDMRLARSPNSFLSLQWTRKTTRRMRIVKMTSPLRFLRRSVLLAIYDIQTSSQISGFSLTRSKGATAGITVTAGVVLTLWNKRKAKCNLHGILVATHTLIGRWWRQMLQEMRVFLLVMKRRGMETMLCLHRARLDSGMEIQNPVVMCSVTAVQEFAFHTACSRRCVCARERDIYGRVKYCVWWVVPTRRYT